MTTETHTHPYEHAGHCCCEDSNRASDNCDCHSAD